MTKISGSFNQPSVSGQSEEIISSFNNQFNSQPPIKFLTRLSTLFHSMCLDNFKYAVSAFIDNRRMHAFNSFAPFSYETQEQKISEGSISEEKAERLLAGRNASSWLLREEDSHLVVSYVAEDAFIAHLAIEKSLEDTLEELKLSHLGNVTLKRREILRGACGKLARAAQAGKDLGLHLNQEKTLLKPMKFDTYAPELLDERHRYGPKIKRVFRIWKSTTSELSFNEWLKALERGEEIDGRIRLIRRGLLKNNKICKKGKEVSRVKYFTQEERKRYKLRFKDGVASTKAEGVLKKRGKPHIFVISEEGKIYIGEYLRGVFNHSSFLSGRPVLSAGKCDFREGNLVKITNKSGHYRTDEWMMELALRELNKIGVDLSDVVLEIKKNSNWIVYNAEDFLDKAYEREEEIKSSSFYLGNIDKDQANAALNDSEEGSWIMYCRSANNQLMLAVKSGSGKVRHRLLKGARLKEIQEKYGKKGISSE